MTPDFILFIRSDLPAENLIKTRKSHLNAESEHGLYVHQKAVILESESDRVHTMVIGDMIHNEDIGDLNPANAHEKKGVFYVLQFNKQLRTFLLYSSLCSLMPLYVLECGPLYVVASNIELIRSNVIKHNNQVNLQYLVELKLFNFAFSSQTILKDVRLLPVHTTITWSNYKISEAKTFEISNLFPVASGLIKQDLNELSDCFMHNAYHYFPDEKCTINFTDGFDGRTLVALALKKGIDFRTFSFGRESNEDVRIPLENSRKLGIEYQWFDLGSEFYHSFEFPEFGRRLIENHGLLSNLIYTHFYRTALTVSEKTKTLLTGYMGSELFRALHIAGAVSSLELFHFFNDDNKDIWIKEIRNSPKLQIFLPEKIEDCVDSIISELENYKSQHDNKVKNHAFYIYVFEEIFRKFFGSLLKVQSEFLTVRAPFLDYDFIDVLLKTRYAGVNNEFFTHNPFKRVKGQLLYANTIRRSSLELANTKVGKGYTPNNLLTRRGTIPIVRNYVQKKLKKRIKGAYLDNLGLISGFHQMYAQGHFVPDPEIYDIGKYQNLSKQMNSLPENLRDLILQTSSASLYIKHLRNE